MSADTTETVAEHSARLQPSIKDGAECEAACEPLLQRSSVGYTQGIFVPLESYNVEQGR